MDQFPQGVEFQGLEQIVVGTPLDCLDREVCCSVPGHENNRDPGIPLLQSLENLQFAGVGQVDVQDHNRQAFLGHYGFGLSPGAGCQQFPAVMPQNLAVGMQDRRLVIHQQDLQHTVCRSSTGKIHRETSAAPDAIDGLQCSAMLVNNPLADHQPQSQSRGLGTEKRLKQAILLGH